MVQPQVIDTEAEIISDEPVEVAEKLHPEDIPREDIPAYTIAGAIEWMHRPENDAQIQAFAGRVRAQWKDMVAAIDREVSKTGKLVVDMAADESVMQDVKDSFLRSILRLPDDY